MVTDRQIEQIKTAELVPYARNARLHSDDQVRQIAESVREFGWTNPVLIDESAQIIAGHGRVMAAKLLALESVPCMRRPIENNSSVGQAVYDPFVGSGTTIIAAEQTLRACYAIEIDPAYVDVCVWRWENASGAAAVHECGKTFEQMRDERTRIAA